MSSRLASFRGPSTPTSSPARHIQPQSPSSPARQVESTYHRKTRIILQDLRGHTETWDDLVLHDGLKSLRTLVDTRTELDNSLASWPDRRPRDFVVGPKLQIMDSCIASLDLVLQKLDKQFRRMNKEIENLEATLIEAQKIKGVKWTHEEPLWCTWSLAKFVTSMPAILIPYHRSLHLHRQLVERVRSHSTPFEKAKEAVTKWAEQPFLVDDGWEAAWEDLCDVEVDRWGKS
ncbi:hypothetical protein DFP72DRAFT_798545 [Ephemerocybe angulata]|uniref:Uncharacterized protein n=1 Tax=Ephemerocybe angulata TaxID=980116 RepID=A0A8H6MHA4_9AGAR|nr:hypothetical protein DFP72DRAFT_798545 [Tulosesus angulatus]